MALRLNLPATRSQIVVVCSAAELELGMVMVQAARLSHHHPSAEARRTAVVCSSSQVLDLRTAMSPLNRVGLKVVFYQTYRARSYTAARPLMTVCPSLRLEQVAGQAAMACP